MKNGSTWMRNKGSFGGSLPGKRKSYSYYRAISFICSVVHKGTVGHKLSRKKS